MQLFYSTTSPYVRKVHVMAIEKGLAEQIALVPCNPHAPGPELLAANPLGRIPTLLRDSGEALFDSPVICEWLDQQGDGPTLVPPAGADRWTVLRVAALADGIMDDAVALVMERRRPAVEQSASTQAMRLNAIRRGLAWLEAQPEWLAGPLSLAQIAVACALGYLDFRLPELGWTGEQSSLAAWYPGFAQRPAMQATLPRDLAA